MGRVLGSIDEHLDDSNSFVPGWGALTACDVDVEFLPLDGAVGTHTTICL